MGDWVLTFGSSDPPGNTVLFGILALQQVRNLRPTEWSGEEQSGNPCRSACIYQTSAGPAPNKTWSLPLRPHFTIFLLQPAGGGDIWGGIGPTSETPLVSTRL